jgi:hypothetical protein
VKEISPAILIHFNGMAWKIWWCSALHSEGMLAHVAGNSSTPFSCQSIHDVFSRTP